MGSPTPSASLVLGHLEKLLESPVFRSTDRSARLLRFLVEETLAGRADGLKEYTIAVKALGRSSSFDPRIDSIARVEVSRLRSRLDQYYATTGSQDPIIFVLPKGSYVPQFENRQQAAAGTNPPSWKVTAFLAFGLGVALSAIWFSFSPWASWRKLAAPARELVQLQLDLLPDAGLANVVGVQLALSPDGTTLVFAAARAGGGSQLYVRRLSTHESVALSGTEGARGPFFSPDGNWVAFWAEGKLKKVPVAGGAPIVLCDASDLLGGSWGDDGSIVAALTSESKLWRVPAAGGQPSAVVDLTPTSGRLMWPQVLPGSQFVVYSRAGTNPDSGTIELLSLRDRTRRLLVRSGVYGRYLPSGHLVYVNQGTLYAQALNTQLQPRGAPAAVLQNLEYSPTFGFAQFDFSRTGTLVYRRNPSAGQFTLEWVDPTGKRSPLITSTGSYLWPRISPDGKYVAVVRLESGDARILILERQRIPLRQARSFESYGAAPLWTPDGRFLIFQGKETIEWAPFPTMQVARPLIKGLTGIMIPTSVSPDGRRLAFYRMDPATHFDLWTVPLSILNDELRAGSPEPFLRTKAVETYPTFSPDGHWIAYVSLQSGGYQVYVRAFPDNGTEVQVSKEGGRLPFWSKNTSDLIYETEDHRIMMVPYRIRNGAFEPGAPRRWVNVPLGDTGVLPNFDLAPDGRIVALMASHPREQASHQVEFVLNFFDHIQRQLSDAGK